jgi:hypothetical protein
MIRCEQPYIQCPFYGEFWSAIIETLSAALARRRAGVPPPMLNQLSRKDQRRPPPPLVPSSWPEEHRSLPATMPEANWTTSPLPSQGQRNEFPASPRCRRWKPYRVWWAGAPVTAYFDEPPPWSCRPWQLSHPRPSIPTLTATIRLFDTPLYFLIWVIDLPADGSHLMKLVDPCVDPLSYPVFMPKPRTHRMHDLGLIVPHIQPKVSTHNQISRIKNIYYISSVSKYYDDSQRNESAKDSLTPQAWQPGQHVAWNSSSKNSSPSSPSEQQGWVAGENSKVEYTYSWYSASAGIKW